MKCPFCGNAEDKVVDSRESKDSTSIRRRRECLECGRRFSTSERIEDSLPMVVKKDDRREPFSREKIIMGIQRACEKRPVAMTQIEELAEHIERTVREMGEKEVSSSVIGEQIIDALRGLDEVAYVRFASVYRQFKDVEEFMRELQDMVQKRGAN